MVLSGEGDRNFSIYLNIFLRSIFRKNTIDRAKPNGLFLFP